VHTGSVARQTGKVEIVPGVEGPKRVVFEDLTTGGITFRLDIRFDPDQQRYICQEIRARGGDGISSETLRYAPVAKWIQLYLLHEEGAIHELPNPDRREPWGLKPPFDAAEAPTSRALRWTAHLYRFGFAVGSNPTKSVEERLGLPRSTAGRWIAKARQAGYLGPSEGAGKAGG
jgi:hypothetical protein